MKKALFIFIALNVLGIGINFVLQAGFGCDAITMINDGIAQFLHTNYTIAGLVYNTIWIILALVFSKNLLGWGSISYAYGTGIFIDVYQRMLQPLNIANASLALQIIVFLIGQVMICFAFAMLIEMQLGRSALDALLSSIERRCHVSYRVIKTICDIVFVFVAFLLGAIFGIGTIVCVLSGGMLIQAFCKILSTNVKKVDVM